MSKKPANFIEELIPKVAARSLDELKLWDALHRNDLYFVYVDAEKITPVLNPDNVYQEEREGTKYVIAFTSRESLNGFDDVISNGGEWQWEKGQVVFRALKRKKMALLLNKGLDFEYVLSADQIAEILEFNNRPEVGTMEGLLALLETQKILPYRHPEALPKNPATKKDTYDETGYFEHEGRRILELDTELDFYQLCRSAEIILPLELNPGGQAVTNDKAKTTVYGKGAAPLPPLPAPEVEEPEEVIDEVAPVVVAEASRRKAPSGLPQIVRTAVTAAVGVAFAVSLFLAGVMIFRESDLEEVERIARTARQHGLEAVDPIGHRVFSLYFRSCAGFLLSRVPEVAPDLAWTLGNEARRHERLAEIAVRVENHPLLLRTVGRPYEPRQAEMEALLADCRRALELLRSRESSPDLPVPMWDRKLNAVDVTAQAYFENVMLGATAYVLPEATASEPVSQRDRAVARAFLAEAYAAHERMTELAARP